MVTPFSFVRDAAVTAEIDRLSLDERMLAPDVHLAGRAPLRPAVVESQSCWRICRVAQTAEYGRFNPREYS